MPTYSESYMHSQDIDWFFCFRGIKMHAASNGGLICEEIDSNINIWNQYQVASFNNEDAFLNDDEIEIDNDYVFSRISKEELYSSYTRSFVEMARKGFYSYDRILNDNNDETTRYHLVAWPRDDKKIQIEELELKSLDSVIKQENEDNFKVIYF